MEKPFPPERAASRPGSEPGNLSTRGFLIKVRKLFLFVPLVMLTFGAVAQDRRQDRSPYLIPQTVYVGDRAALILPQPVLLNAGDIVLDPLSPDFPSLPEMDIHRVVLESRPSGSRLVVEFSAFVPGILEFPPIEIGGQWFGGIKVEISSIIGDSDSAVLSAPLAPVSIPGTSFFVYGTLAGIVLFLFLVLWMSFRGRRHLSRWIIAWKRRRLIAGMAGVEKRLRRSLRQGGEKQGILDLLSAEFRNFLSIFTGENCRTRTAGEFVHVPLTFPGLPGEWGPGFLRNFFRRCDDLRFGGAEVVSADVMFLLGELKEFLAALDNAGRRKIKQGGQRK
jgi:hypothetical protein